MSPRSYAELEQTLAEIRQSPRDRGTVQLIVRRPAIDEREILAEAALSPTDGLTGDHWRPKSRPVADLSPGQLAVQLTLMNSRAIASIAGPKEHWPPAGDQLYVDFDLSLDNLPPGTQLSIGTAVIEVSAEPHPGCGKFRARFGTDALRFVNSPVGRQLNLRGINARIVQGGIVRVGDAIAKLPLPAARTDK